MKVDLRQPAFYGTEKEKLQQMSDYLFQLKDQLQWAFENIEADGIVGGGGTSTTTVITQTTESTETRPPTEEEAELTFNAIKALIIKSADIVDAYYTEINSRLEEIYVASSDFGEFTGKTVADIARNSTAISQNYASIETLSVETDKRITEARELTGAKIENQGIELKQKIEGVTQDLIDTANELSRNISEVDGRADVIEQNAEKIRDDLSSATSSISGLARDLDQAQKQFSENLNEITGNDGPINSLRAQIANEKETREKSIADINTSLSRFETVYNEVDNDRESYALIVKSNGYVKSGKIYDEKNGIPVYGIEVGQAVEINGKTEYRGFARFVSNEIVFFDENNLRSAWLSKRRLHATEVEATEKQKIGGFVDMVDAVTGDVTTVWEG